MHVAYSSILEDSVGRWTVDCRDELVRGNNQSANQARLSRNSSVHCVRGVQDVPTTLHPIYIERFPGVCLSLKFDTLGPLDPLDTLDPLEP